jgi:predicted regulator of Ras-like GTPase activity (Roadblock/LC7/MglB family)
MAVGGAYTEDFGFVEDAFSQMQRVVSNLVKVAGIVVSFLIDKNGCLIVASGDVDNLDTTNLAALTPEALDQLLGSERCAQVRLSDERRCVRVHLVGDRALLVSIFDAERVGVAALRMRQAVRDLERMLGEFFPGGRDGGDGGASGAPALLSLGRITPDDLKNLLG